MILHLLTPDEFRNIIPYVHVKRLCVVLYVCVGGKGVKVKVKSFYFFQIKAVLFCHNLLK